MGVDIQGQAYSGVPEPLLHHLGMNSLLKHQARCSVPEIVEANVREIGLPQQHLEMLEDITGVQRRSDSGREDQSPVLAIALP